MLCRKHGPKVIPGFHGLKSRATPSGAPADQQTWANEGFMLDQRHKRWASIETMVECLYWMEVDGCCESVVRAVMAQR